MLATEHGAVRRNLSLQLLKRGRLRDSAFSRENAQWQHDYKEYDEEGEPTEECSLVLR